MIWIILLCVVVFIAGCGIYKKSGEGYSAGRGLFRMSDDDIYSDKDKQDFWDYEPFNYDEVILL